MTDFVEMWLKIDFIVKGILFVHNYIFKVWEFWNIVIDSSSTQVDSSVIHETRVGTLTTRGSTTH